MSAPLSDFTRHRFDPARCRKDALELQRLLARPPPLEDNKDLIPFFKARPDLTAALGFYDTFLIREGDLIAYELELFGLYRSDIVVGDSSRHTFGFVELEDAK